MNRTIPNGAAILLAFIRRTEVGRDDRVHPWPRVSAMWMLGQRLARTTP